MTDPCIPFTARVTRFMSARAWRGFLAAHPGWHAPAVLGGCVRAGAVALPLLLPGAALPGYPITEPARSGVWVPRIPGSAPSADFAQEEGATATGGREVVGLPPVAIAAGGSPALYQVVGPEAPGCCAMLLGLPNVPLLQVGPGETAPPRFLARPEGGERPEPVAVDEPASVALLGAGLVLVGFFRRQRT